MTTLMRRKRGDGTPTMRSNLSEIFDMDLDTMFGRPLMSSMMGTRGREFVPATNIRETDNEFVVELAAPGLKRNDFTVDIDNNVLEISVEKEEKKKEKEAGFTRREYNFNSFYRSFRLPEYVDSDKIKAKYEEGILKITLPKTPEARKKPVKEIAIS